ncbi:MAG: hypothetical protein NVS3B12_10900 [Acidimicrobiales bacterium]
MMIDSCSAWKGLLAAYALGQVDDAERLAVVAHLDGCEPCRGALDELGMPARALTFATVEHLGSVGRRAPDRLGPAIMAKVEYERTKRRTHNRLIVSVVSIAAIALVVVASLGLLRPAAAPPGEQIALSGGNGVVAQAVLDRRPWGTQMTVTVEGLAPGSVHSVWLASADGRRTPAGTFTAVRNRRLRVVLADALPADQSVAVGISDMAGLTVAQGRLH